MSLIFMLFKFIRKIFIKNSPKEFWVKIFKYNEINLSLISKIVLSIQYLMTKCYY